MPIMEKISHRELVITGLGIIATPVGGPPESDWLRQSPQETTKQELAIRHEGSIASLFSSLN